MCVALESTWRPQTVSIDVMSFSFVKKKKKKKGGSRHVIVLPDRDSTMAMIPLLERDSAAKGCSRSMGSAAVGGDSPEGMIPSTCP